MEWHRLSARALWIGQHVDDQPRLVQAEIDLTAARACRTSERAPSQPIT
jgi:hypothetical protein